MSEYSDFAWGGENVSADMSWPVVEEIMDESRHTEPDIWGWGATRAIILFTVTDELSIFNPLLSTQSLIEIENFFVTNYWLSFTSAKNV